MYFVFFNDTATTEIYTLSLHDALPICERDGDRVPREDDEVGVGEQRLQEARADQVRRRLLQQVRLGHVPVARPLVDRKSTRLNSSHANISYAVFCLKKKKKNYN